MSEQRHGGPNFERLAIEHLHSMCESLSDIATALQRDEPQGGGSAPATLSDLSRFGQRLEDLILTGQQAALKQIDDETNALGTQIEKLTSGLTGNVTSEQLDAFRGIVDKLKQIAHAATLATNSET